MFQARLDFLLQRQGFHRQLAQIQRMPNPFSSAFPSEIVLCRFTDGDELRLLLKYGLENKHVGHGYWGDVGYEARVYEEILQQLPTSLPKFFGAFPYDTNGQMCLVLEYLDRSLRLDKSPSQALLLAAGWLGHFHAAAADLANRPVASSFLACYDAAYYVGWAQRTSTYAGKLHRAYPWLLNLCRRFEALIPVLVNGPATIIHGEFYPANILVLDGAAYPVDWQSAAIARGEIDLASLLEGWGRTGLVQECEDIYQRCRWPDGPPDDFGDALRVARLYWPLRWLGDDPKWTRRRSKRYFQELYEEAEIVGII